jgi:hypothetical protein
LSSFAYVTFVVAVKRYKFVNNSEKNEKKQKNNEITACELTLTPWMYAGTHSRRIE